MGIREVAVVVAALAFPGAATAARPLETAVVDPGTFGGMASEIALKRAHGAGATKVRVILDWRAVAPAGSERPTGFVASNHEDPHYQWQAVDRQLGQAWAAGLEPFVTVQNAPDWAEVEVGATARPPSPMEIGHFAAAAARRYSGAFEDLPRIRYWQVWNEPNISLFLRPQFVGRRPFSPGWYRKTVNEFSAAVKRVHADNLVIAGGTAPFRDITPEVQQIDPRWGPLSFMRALLCLSKTLKPTCKQRIRFDIWAHHPYTSGGPTRHAVLPDDVSLGDLPEMREVLKAGIQAGNVVSRGAVQFWVTEFSWDSNGPDPKGVPTGLHTRWVAESLYRMWKNGVSLVTWFLLRDQPLASSFYQSGLYYRGASLEQDRPKPALQAFRFPVVALPDARGVLVWGRTPAELRGRVIVEQSFKGGWKRLALVTTDRYGIFQRRFPIPHLGAIRARLVRTGEKSIPFGVKPVPDRFFNPFGQTTPLEPKRP